MRRFLKLLTIGYFLVAIGLEPFALKASPFYPADPDAAAKQWHLQKIEAYEAWSKTQGSADVVVAVIDTGVDINHPDLKPNIWKNSSEILDGRDNDGNIYVDDLQGWDFIGGDNNPSPDIDEPDARTPAIQHGTLVAGLIGAVGNNGIGGTGIAWNVKIMPLRALDSRGRGDVGTVIEAIRYAVNKGADVINLSFVGPGFERELFVVLQDAMRKGVLVVAAVGNNEGGGGTDLDTSPLYPVCYSGTTGEDVALGVAATDEQDRKSTFSNYGANCVDISAPGSSMYSTQYYNPGRGFSNLFGNGWSGSSMAAPIVSGAAALLKSLNPSLRGQDIRNVLVQSSDPIDLLNPGFAGKLGRGRLNIRKAMELSALGGSATFTPSSGVTYIAAAPASSAIPEVKVLFGSGILSNSFLAYGTNFRGGVNLASGDVDGDGMSEIVAGAGFGGGPHVRIFNAGGKLVGTFFAYDPRFRGGVSVAAGDLNGDSIAEIVTAAGPGGGPHIRIFNAGGQFLGGFFAYGTSLRGGVNLAVADLDRDGSAEIIASPGIGSGYKGEIKIFDMRGRLKKTIAAYPANFLGGVSVAAGDLDGDGIPELVTAPYSGAVSEVRVYSDDGVWQRAFLAYNDAFRGGVRLAIGDTDRDGASEIITGPGKGGGPHVIVFDGFGRIKNQFFPFDNSFKGGVSVGIIRL